MIFRRERDADGGDGIVETVLNEAETQPLEGKPWSRLLPGMAIAALLGAAAGWIGRGFGIPIALAGLFLGMALNFISGNPRTHPGLDAISGHGLRTGIVLLGFQVKLTQVVAIGIVPFAGLALVMSASVVAAMLAARMTRQGPAVGLLAGGATAICGASAALALYGVIGRERIGEAQFALTLVAISLASGIALATYPALAMAFGFNETQSGFLVGASIHDVAQAVGAGFAISDSAGVQATVIKLTRVALLVPLTAICALWIARAHPLQGAIRTARSTMVPGFMIAFIAVVTVNSLVSAPPQLTSVMLGLSKTLLVLAITATALRTRIGLLLALGWQSVLPVLAATFASLSVALVFARWAL